MFLNEIAIDRCQKLPVLLLALVYSLLLVFVISRINQKLLWCLVYFVLITLTYAMLVEETLEIFEAGFFSLLLDEAIVEQFWH